MDRPLHSFAISRAQRVQRPRLPLGLSQWGQQLASYNNSPEVNWLSAQLVLVDATTDFLPKIHRNQHHQKMQSGTARPTGLHHLKSLANSTFRASVGLVPMEPTTSQLQQLAQDQMALRPACLGGCNDCLSSEIHRVQRHRKMQSGTIRPTF